MTDEVTRPLSPGNLVSEFNAAERRSRARRWPIMLMLATLATALTFVAVFVSHHKTCLDAWRQEHPSVVGEWEHVSSPSAFERVSLPPRVRFSANGRYETLGDPTPRGFRRSGSYDVEGSRLRIFADYYGSKFDVCEIELRRFGCDLIVDYEVGPALHYRRIH